MLAVIVLVLKLLWRGLDLGVDKLGPESHLCNLFKDYCAVNGVFGILAPAERPVILAEDCGNSLIILVQPCELIDDQMSRILFVSIFDLFSGQAAESGDLAVEIVCMVVP